MKTSKLAFFAIGAVLTLPLLAKAGSAADNRVDVTYVSPEKFTDFKDSWTSTERDRDHLCSEFTKHIKKVAADVLPADARLEVKFTDINLAGEYEPQRGPNFNDVRIMKDIYPPRMQLEFRLVGADGKVISEGKRQLIDTNYQGNSLAFDSDPLKYDKTLLTTWMNSEFHKKG